MNFLLQTVFAKGGHYALKSLSASGYDVIGLDWTINPAEARKIVGCNITLQGNLDPCALYASKEDLEISSKKQVAAFGSQRWIANLGHGIYPDTDPEKLGAYIEAIQRNSKAN